MVGQVVQNEPFSITFVGISNFIGISQKLRLVGRTEENRTGIRTGKLRSTQNVILNQSLEQKVTLFQVLPGVVYIDKAFTLAAMITLRSTTLRIVSALFCSTKLCQCPVCLLALFYPNNSKAKGSPNELKYQPINGSKC